MQDDDDDDEKKEEDDDEEWKEINLGMEICFNSVWDSVNSHSTLPAHQHLIVVISGWSLSFHWSDSYK